MPAHVGIFFVWTFPFTDLLRHSHQIRYLFLAVVGYVVLLGFVGDRQIAGAILFCLDDDTRDQRVDRAIQVRIVVRRSTDDQRRAGFIDQDRVDFVDDRVILDALHLVGG